MKPSTSTVASVALGAPLAVLIAWILKEFLHVEMPPEVQTAAGAVISAGVGYFFIGGKASDTE